ncbi:MAG TPA: hypothetical protein VGS00_00710 [Thermoanaerobaculia bacterium]|nr:hypothetical protein [Thermoanaerobaculia bacterium]
MPALRGRELAAYLLFSALWSGNWLVIRLGLADLPPFLFAGLRLALASVLLGAVVLGRETLTPRALAGGALILAGVALVALARVPAERTAA